MDIWILYCGHIQCTSWWTYLLLMLLVCWSGVYGVGVGIGLFDVLFHYVGQGLLWVEFTDILLIEQADHSHHRVLRLRLNGTKFLLKISPSWRAKGKLYLFLHTTRDSCTKDPIVNCSLFPLDETYYRKINTDGLQREYEVGPPLQYSCLPTHWSSR
jgi:hypothetical protein